MEAVWQAATLRQRVSGRRGRSCSRDQQLALLHTPVPSDHLALLDRSRAHFLALAAAGGPEVLRQVQRDSQKPELVSCDDRLPATLTVQLTAPRNHWESKRARAFWPVPSDMFASRAHLVRASAAR